MKEIKTSYKDLLKISQKVRGRMMADDDRIKLVTATKTYIAVKSKKVS